MLPPNLAGLALHLEGVVTSRVACLVTCPLIGNFYPLIPRKSTRPRLQYTVRDIPANLATQ
jgi:hypothetical protein